MARYKVQWKYVSSLGGPWMEGDTIDIDIDLAEHINRDSPGVLRVEKGERIPANDRMQKRAERQRAQPEPEKVTEPDVIGQLLASEPPDDRQGGAGDQGAMSSQNFQAVHDGE